VINFSNNTFYFGLLVSLSFTLILITNLSNKSGLSYVLFLFTLFGFLINPFFLELYNPGILMISKGSFKFYDYDIEVVRMSSLNIIIFIYFIDFFYLYFKKNIIANNSSTNFLSYKVGKFLFFLTAPIYLYLISQTILTVISEGYLSIFNNDKKDLNVFFRLSKNVIHFAFALILVSRVPRFKIKKYLLLYLSIMLFTLLTGQRGEALKFFFTALVIYSSIYEIQYDFKKILFYLVFTFVLAFSISLYRSSESAKAIIFSTSNTQIVTDFVASQSKSYMILSSSIQNENSLNYTFLGLIAELRSMSGSIMSRITGINNEVNEDIYLSMKEYGHLGSTISYYLNQKQFFEGKGLGTTFIAEIFLVFGLYGQIFIAFILAFLFRQIEYIKYFSFNKSVLLFFICSSLIFIGRDTTINFISDNLIYIILLFCFYFYEKIFLHILPKK